MITEEEIKNVFRECGFHVTPTNMHSRVDEFDPHTGDLVKNKYVVGSEWYNIKSGGEIPEDFNSRLGNCLPVESTCLCFTDINMLVEILKGCNPMRIVEGDVYSYLIHAFDSKNGVYYLYGAIHSSDHHAWQGDLFWMNREKLIKDKEDFKKSDLGKGCELLNTRYTGSHTIP